MEDMRTVAAVRPARRRRRVWMPLLAMALLAALAVNILLFLKYHAAVRNNPLSQQAQIEAAVEQAVLTPAGTPVISTVADKSKLTNPSLAGVVKNGDKILIYGSAHRLIIYRPSIQKVVTMLDIKDSPAQ